MTAQRVTAGLLVTGAAALLILFGDPFSLQLVAYLPILIFGWVFTPDDMPNPLDILGSWLLWRSVATMLGAAVLLMVARRLYSSRPLLADLDRRAVAQVLNGSVAVATLVPLLYAATRLAWAAGIPLGIDPDFLAEIQPIVVNGLVLALLAVGGAALTVGLVRPWGEVFWRWLPFVGGKPVPVTFVRRFAFTVALLVTAGGFYFIREMVDGGPIGIAPEGAEHQWAAWLPELLWPVWGIALAAATVAYGERRRRQDAILEERHVAPAGG